MNWIEINTHFPNDPRVLDIGVVAEALWLRGICHCYGTKNNNLVPHEFVDAMTDVNGREQADVLVQAGLWQPTVGGWYVLAMVDLWKFGPSNASDRNVPQYYQWRKAVLDRDGKTCQDCGVDEGEMHAHHLKPWATHPGLRFDLDNGITLCPDCHRDRHREAVRR